MSYIGRLPIKIPLGVNVDIGENQNTIKVSGPHGEFEMPVTPGIFYNLDETQTALLLSISHPKYKKFWGITRTLLANNITGISREFQMKLELVGVGYKARVDETYDGISRDIIEEELVEKYKSEKLNKKDLADKIAESFIDKTPESKQLILKLGFSHEIILDIPESIQVSCPNYSTLVLTGNEKDILAKFAAKIRSYRLPEPYKGKGIKFRNEIIRRKEGKKK